MSSDFSRWPLAVGSQRPIANSQSLSDNDFLCVDCFANHSEDVNAVRHVDCLYAVDLGVHHHAACDVEHLQCAVAVDDDIAAVLECECLVGLSVVAVLVE